MLSSLAPPEDPGERARGCLMRSSSERRPAIPLPRRRTAGLAARTACSFPNRSGASLQPSIRRDHDGNAAELAGSEQPKGVLAFLARGTPSAARGARDGASRARRVPAAAWRTSVIEPAADGESADELQAPGRGTCSGQVQCLPRNTTCRVFLFRVAVLLRSASRQEACTLLLGITGERLEEATRSAGPTNSSVLLDHFGKKASGSRSATPKTSRCCFAWPGAIASRPSGRFRSGSFRFFSPRSRASRRPGSSHGGASAAHSNSSLAGRPPSGPGKSPCCLSGSAVPQRFPGHCSLPASDWSGSDAASGGSAWPSGRTWSSFGTASASGRRRANSTILSPSAAAGTVSSTSPSMPTSTRFMPANVLWKEAWKGNVTSDTFRTVRKGLLTGFTAQALPETCRRCSRAGRASTAGRLPGPVEGHWQRIDPEPGGPGRHRRGGTGQGADQAAIPDATACSSGSFSQNELPLLQWRPVFRSLRLMELSGEVLSGYFFRRPWRSAVHCPRKPFRLLQEPLPEDAVFWINAADPASLCGSPLSPGSSAAGRLDAPGLSRRPAGLIIANAWAGRSRSSPRPEDPRMAGISCSFQRPACTAISSLLHGSWSRPSTASPLFAARSPQVFKQVGFRASRNALELWRDY